MDAIGARAEARVIADADSGISGYDDPHEGHVTVTAISQLLAN